MDEKHEPTNMAVAASEVGEDTLLGLKTGTARDAQDMKRMGKKQEFRVSRQQWRRQVTNQFCAA